MAHPTLDPKALQEAIHAAGLTWTVRTPPVTELHGLGRLAPDPQDVQRAIAKADDLLESSLRTGVLALSPSHSVAAPGPEAAPAAAVTPPPLPREVDWRTHGIIGPVLDQGQCGSCVSCATTGMASSMAWKELGVRGLILSAADQHFCSSHGANCGGWNEAPALGQIQSRGVVPEEVFPYMSAFDSPPKVQPRQIRKTCGLLIVARRSIAVRGATESPTTAPGPPRCLDCPTMRVSTTWRTSDR